MTIRHLKIFITVYDEKNMTAAASKLFITQPTVSQAIQELESEYKVILFERLSRKLYPTPSGDKLYQYATHIIKLVEDMEESIRENSLMKKLTIGANYTAGVRDLFESKMNQLGLPVTAHWESASTTALIQAAKNQLGVAVVPLQLVKEHLALGLLKEIKVKGLEQGRELAIVYHKNKLLTETIRDFMKICHQLNN